MAASLRSVALAHFFSAAISGKRPSCFLRENRNGTTRRPCRVGVGPMADRKWQPPWIDGQWKAKHGQGLALDRSVSAAPFSRLASTLSTVADSNPQRHSWSWMSAHDGRPNHIWRPMTSKRTRKRSVQGPFPQYASLDCHPPPFTRK